MFLRVPFLTAEWRNLAMLNFAVPRELLEPLVPDGTVLDTYRGVAYVSLVGFLFLKTKVLGLPVLFHQRFEEVNLRFYVRRFSGEEWRRGVVFIKEIVPAFLISASARLFYNENYITCPMRHRTEQGAERNAFEYEWQFGGCWHRLEVVSNTRPKAISPGSLEEFISHHEWGYTRQCKGRCLEYRVVHPCWEVAQAAEATVECDAGAVYGKEFSNVLANRPDSAFAISGSAVKVYRGKALTAPR